MTDDELLEHARARAKQAPPLTDRQKRALRALLNPQRPAQPAA